MTTSLSCHSPVVGGGLKTAPYGSEVALRLSSRAVREAPLHPLSFPRTWEPRRGYLQFPLPLMGEGWGDGDISPPSKRLSENGSPNECGKV